MGFKKKFDLYIERKIRKIFLEILNERKHNIKDGLQELALRETCIWIQENVPVNLMFEDRFELLSKAITQIDIENGLVLEFGVYKGETINHIAKNVNENKIIYGFDSFEGLQEPWIFQDKGGFSDVNGKLPVVLDNVNLIKGFFSETLPKFVSNQSTPIGLLHIDSDLYSSAKTILHELNHLIIEDTVIVFDEFFNYPGWKNGEFKAWIEFLEQNEIEFEYIGFTFQRTLSKKSGNQLAVKVTKRF